jgi:hypothetical protein
MQNSGIFLRKMIEIVAEGDAISVAVPGVLVGGRAPSSLTDRGLSLRSLSLPQAALPSLPFCILHFSFCIFIVCFGAVKAEFFGAIFRY